MKIIFSCLLVFGLLVTTYVTSTYPEYTNKIVFTQCPTESNRGPKPPTKLRLLFPPNSGDIPVNYFNCYKMSTGYFGNLFTPTRVMYHIAYGSETPFENSSLKCEFNENINLEIYQLSAPYSYNTPIRPSRIPQYDCTSGYQSKRAIRNTVLKNYIPDEQVPYLLQPPNSTNVGRNYIENAPHFNLYSKVIPSFKFLNLQLALLGWDYCVYIGLSYSRSFDSANGRLCFQKVSQTCFDIKANDCWGMSRIWETWEFKPKPKIKSRRPRSNSVSKGLSDGEKIICFLIFLGVCVVISYCCQFLKAYGKSRKARRSRQEQLNRVTRSRLDVPAELVLTPPQFAILFEPTAENSSVNSNSTSTTRPDHIINDGRHGDTVELDLPPDYESLPPPAYEDVI